MQGIGVDLVIIISYKHSSVCMPVVPQHTFDSGTEVWQLKAGVCRLVGHTQTYYLITEYIVLSKFQFSSCIHKCVSMCTDICRGEQEATVLVINEHQPCAI